MSFLGFNDFDESGILMLVVLLDASSKFMELVEPI